MNEDEIKDEAMRLCNPLHTVCHALRQYCKNDTGYIVVDDHPCPVEAGWRRGTVRFTIRVSDGHTPPSHVRRLFERLTEFKWNGMTLVSSEHKSLRDTTLVYDADFSWKSS